MAGVFNAASTTNELVRNLDLSGKRILVTGVSAGLGIETARSLAAHGAQVVGAARDLSKAKAATKQVQVQAANGGGLDVVELDLAALTSVRACADVLISTGKPLDLVIANAGVMACPEGATADGFEIQFGTNHIGHFVLVKRSHIASTRFRPPQPRPKDASAATAHLCPIESSRWSKTMSEMNQWIFQAAAAVSLARTLYPDTGRPAATGIVHRRRRATSRDAAFSRLLRGLAKPVAAWHERRATINVLATMSDRDLADIGLDKFQIRRVFDPQFARERDLQAAASRGGLTLGPGPQRDSSRPTAGR